MFPKIRILPKGGFDNLISLPFIKEKLNIKGEVTLWKQFQRLMKINGYLQEIQKISTAKVAQC